MESTVLLCDISKGEQACMALSKGSKRPTAYVNYTIRSLEDFESALHAYLKLQNGPALTAAAISAPGWEVGGGLSMPNHNFRVEREWLRDLLHVQRLHLVNCSVSKAMSIQRLEPDELMKVCGGEGDPDQVKGMIGAGYGLGLAGIVPDDLGNWHVLPCEGGHSDLPAVNAREQAVIGLMIEKYGHVSRERAISVPGLVEIWRCLGVLDGKVEPLIEAEVIVARANAGDTKAREAVDLCLGWLAAMASDAALMLGARGGIYMAGPLIELLQDQFAGDLFGNRFCDKGRLSNFMADIPVYVVKIKESEILGLTTLFN